jgi:hypothetical protein
MYLTKNLAYLWKNYQNPINSYIFKRVRNKSLTLPERFVLYGQPLIWKTIPWNQGAKIGIPKVFRRIPNSSTNICGIPRNSDSYPPNTLSTISIQFPPPTQIDMQIRAINLMMDLLIQSCCQFDHVLGCHGY